MNLLIVMILSLISITFLLIGTFIVFKTGNSKKIVTFSVSLGFVVLLLLGVLHLIPDSYEFFKESLSKTMSITALLLITALGFILVYIIDSLGGHHHEHDEIHEEGHYKHISLITCIFLIVHNFIEGITLYSTALLNYQIALMLTLGIGLHNIPLGFTLSSTYYKDNSKIKTILFISFIGVSYIFGALFAYIFNNIIIKPIILGSALTLTFGMILYIAIKEFLPLIRESKDFKSKLYGIIIGIVLMIFTLFI